MQSRSALRPDGRNQPALGLAGNRRASHDHDSTSRRPRLNHHGRDAPASRDRRRVRIPVSGATSARWCGRFRCAPIAGSTWSPSARRQTGRERTRSARLSATSSMRAMSGNPPASRNAGRVDEHRLVAGGDSADPRSQVHRALDDAQHRVSTVEPHVEPAPFAIVTSERIANQLGPPARKPRIGVGETAASCRVRPQRRRSSGVHGPAARRADGRIAARRHIASDPDCRRRPRSPRRRARARTAAHARTARACRLRRARGRRPRSSVKSSHHGGMRSAVMRNQVRAPPQLLPCPAVHPKQWSRIAIGRPSMSFETRSVTWVRDEPLRRIASPSIWLKSQS